jgi:hypothetical protein
MVVTAHPTDQAVSQGCTDRFFSSAYAVYDGADWNLQRDGNGCLKYFKGMQAMFPVHRGGSLYKMYFNDNEGQTLEEAMSPDFFNNKPIQVVYANGAVTGDEALVDFEDWEPMEDAREVVFVFEDGTELTPTQKSRIDDHSVFMPTGSPDVQLFYGAMSCGIEENPDCNKKNPPDSGQPDRYDHFIGVAQLQNP